jgi:thiol:disulfide interchange protein DsbC
MKDVLEVVVNGEVVYVAADGSHLLQGRLYDTKQRSDLTAGTENGLRRDVLSKVGDERRIRFAAADEKHRITIFTDVDCGYCRKLHQQMSAINAAGITVDYLMFPRAGQPSASFDKAAFVWCAVDQQDALTASMLNGELAADQRKSCTHPVADTMKLGQRLAKLGTPTIIASDGSVLGGYLEPAQLAQRLASVQEVPSRP